ncbi:MAG: hypothetical protein K2K06_11535, partial [Oscillospiraceae bacterium]|nr:hypothetical protein [Oscillospiraceae bacterium]
SFDRLAETYGEELNHNINAGKTLYTLHDFDHHCYNIYKIIDYLFFSSVNFFILNDDTKYIFKLYLAVLFHDIGMTAFNLDRGSHPQKSAEEVERLWKNSDSILHKERRNNILDGNDIDEIKLIILAHSDIKGDAIPDNRNGLLNEDFTEHDNIVRILAGILRLADEFDCDETRLGDESRLEQLNTTDPDQKFSKECWEKLKCIKKLEFADDNIKVILLRLNNQFISDRSNLEIVYNKYLPEIITKIQKELDYVNKNVFNKKFCSSLSFKVEKVLYFRNDCVKGLDDSLLYPVTFNSTHTNSSLKSSASPTMNSSPMSNSKGTTKDYSAKKTSYSRSGIFTTDAVLRLDSLSNSNIFWGKGDKPSFFYNYASNSQQSVSGLTSLNSFEKPIPVNKLDDWIKENWLNDKNTFIHLVIGYAGCGKTTFTNYLLRKQNKNKFVSYWDFYETQYIIGIEQSEGLNLYLKNNLVNNIKCHFKKSKKPKALLDRFRNNLRYLNAITSFSSNSKILISSLEESLKEKQRLDEFDIKDEFYDKYAGSLNQAILLGLTFIWNASILNNSTPIVCVFDGLDIIEDPKILVNFIHSVYLILGKYRSLTNMKPIKAVFTCRKFTYALLESSRGDVSFSERNSDYRNSVSLLDISNLYQVNRVLTYKARIAYDNPNILNLSNEDIEKCKHIAEIPNIISDILDNNSKSNDSFSLSKIVNHNLRSAASLFHTVFKKKGGLYGSVSMPFNHKCYIGYFVHQISHELNNKAIWANMGYGGDDTLCIVSSEKNSKRSITLYDEQNETFPTTLSRMILTLLYRHGKEMSLKEIYEQLKWIPYQNIKKGDNIETIKLDDVNYLSFESFAECIADMLNRSSSNNDEIAQEGIWRRPLYFGNHALTTSNIYEKKQFFKEQFTKMLKNNSVEMPTFKISECGEEFIDTFAIHFEFNAVRHCNTDKPLWMIQSKNDIKLILEKVYNSVSRCMEKQIWLDNFYSKTHSDNYIGEKFHPITKREQRPQLHIIRVIFSHIAYLDSIRTLLWEDGKCNKTSKEIISSLNKGIGNYLKLLENNLKKFNADVSTDNIIFGKIN